MKESTTQSRRLRDGLRELIVAHGALDQSQRPCGAPISFPHACALLELFTAQTPLTTSDLAARLSIDRTNVSRLCARMEKEGELLRVPHPDDGRARVLELSARGKALAKSVDETSAQHFQALATTLGQSTEDVLESLQLLERAITTNGNK